MIRVLLLISFAFLLAGCATVERCNEKFGYQEEKPIIELTEREIPLTLRVPPVYLRSVDTVKITKSGNIVVAPSLLETEFAISKAWIEQNKLKHTLDQKQALIDTVVTVQEKIITVTEPVYTERVPLTWKIGMVVVAIFAALIGFVFGQKMDY